MAEPFTNEPIDVADLPQLRDEAFVPVDPRYLRASLLAFATAAGVIAGGGAMIASQAEEAGTVAAITGALLGLVGLGALLRTLEVRRLAYQVRAHDLSMRSGVITHRTESLPFARVQHVRIQRGAIERTLGLATLHVSSAGPNITIPGLSDADAERIKLLVTERAGDVAEPESDEAERGVAVSSPPPPFSPPPPSPTPPFSPPPPNPSLPSPAPPLPSPPSSPSSPEQIGGDPPAMPT